MTNLFFYGTLRHEALLQTVLGDAGVVALRPARLPDYRAYWADGHGFPFLTPEPGAEAIGLLAEGLSDAAIARLDFYEGGFGYGLHPVQVQASDGPVSAQVWLVPEGQYKRGAVFDLADWIERRAALNIRAASEVMSLYGLRSAEDVARMYPMIEMRAHSWVMGSMEQVPDAPGGMTRADVDVIDCHQPYIDYFAVEAQRLRFRKFSREMGPVVNYASFVATDASLVLPYDPVRDRVMLVEQFRMGPLVRGDRVPWQLEPIAGRIDAGETPEQTARREALEEAGLELQGLELISRAYPTPGCSNEYFHTYLGLADLPDNAAGLGGLLAESEDIRSHILSFDAAMAMADRGEIRVVPLLMALYWLARQRDRLRAGA
jgi:ADP-ribose pyrophosphatase